jgi:phosphatidylglycerophosphatase A
MKDNIISFIVTCGGAGRIKYFPGTFGSFIGLLLGIAIILFTSHNFFLICFFVLMVIAIFSTEEYLKTSESSDPQEIVIDEVLGQWIAIAFIPFTSLSLLLAFIIFRFLDMTKLYPINKIEKIKGYIGVIGDDIFAGIITSLIIITLHIFKVL